MAKIPIYQQGNLASPVVGTPGVDTSVVNAANSVESSLHQLGNTAYQSLENDYVLQQRALRQQQAANDAAQKHLMTLHNEGDAGAKASGVDIAANDLNNSLRTKHETNIDGAREEFDKGLDDLINDKLDAETDPERKAMLQIKLNNVRESQTKSFSTWMTGQIPQIAKGNADTVGSALAYSVNDPKLSGTQVLDKIKKFEENPDNIKQYQAAHGTGWLPEVRKKQSQAAQNFLAAVANTGDEKRLKTLMGDKRFDSYIQGTDKEQFYSRIRALSSARRSEQNIQYDLQNTDTRSQIATTVISKDPGSMDSLTQTGQKLQGFLDAELKKPLAQRSTETISKLENEIEQNHKEIKNYPKAQRLEAQERQKELNAKQNEKYVSQDAIDARSELSQLNKEITTNLKSTWRGNKRAAQAAIDTYQKKLYAAAKAGYMDKPGTVTHYEKHSTDLGIFIKKAGGLPLTPIDALGEAVNGLGHAAQQFFGGAPAKPGQTTKQTHDAMNNAYQEALQKNTKRFMDLKKRQPQAGDLKILDALSKKQAFNQVHGSN